MKLLGLPTLILCIHLSQICSSRQLFAEDMNRKVKAIRDSIYGVSEQFMDDVKVIFDEYRNNSMIFYVLSEGFYRIEKDVLKKENVKMDEKMLRDYYAIQRRASALDNAIKIDNMKIYQSILSKQLPPERYQGVMNLFYVIFYPNATTEEIESALGYLYGTDTSTTKISFLDKFPNMDATDCVDEHNRYSVSSAENFLKSMIDIKPKVIEDFMAIRDKFPCNSDNVLVYLQIFVELLERYQGSDSKDDACLVKEKPGQWQYYWNSLHNTRHYMESQLLELESVLSARLPDETYGGIIKFLRATMPDTPIDEIEKALEYLYDDVSPKAKCPEKEGAKMETE